MDQLELAIQYLKERAVGTQHIPNGLMKEMITVLPLSEVEAVLEMVKEGKFSDFYDKIKRDEQIPKSHPKKEWIELQNGTLLRITNSNNPNQAKESQPWRGYYI